MSTDKDTILERYRAARMTFNKVNEQQETLYHKRQRLTLEHTRTKSYKQTLLQSQRREWSKYRHYASQYPVRLSTNIRQTFQITEKTLQQSSDIHSPTVQNTLPPRIYPSICNLRQITSQKLMNMEILHQTCFVGQFDKKFLITKYLIHHNQIQLILFDQHAISERILLERLQTHFQQENTHTIPFHLSEPATIPRNPRFLYTSEQISLLERTGFIFSSISTHNLLVRAVPGWLLTLGQRQSTTSLLDNIIYDTITKILLQTINQSKLLMYDTLKSLACHNAIKFNDILSKNECNHLLNELKSCSMPFICAHGRTSAAILWEYETISDDYQVNMMELKQLASIHKWLKES
ncbi:hypothetical protein I4U23_023960 [Adineta vaga]|nr:hypothetical protein I4U23_023960 [Adineta vaga]